MTITVMKSSNVPYTSDQQCYCGHSLNYFSYFNDMVSIFIKPSINQLCHFYDKNIMIFILVFYHWYRSPTLTINTSMFLSVYIHIHPHIYDIWIIWWSVHIIWHITHICNSWFPLYYYMKYHFLLYNRLKICNHRLKLTSDAHLYSVFIIAHSY